MLLVQSGALLALLVQSGALLALLVQTATVASQKSRAVPVLKLQALLENQHNYLITLHLSS